MQHANEFADPIRSDYVGIPQVARVLDEYVAGLPRQLALLTDATRGRQTSVIRRLAHQIRGTAGSYGFSQLSQLATELETSAGRNHAFETIEACVGTLVGIIRRVEGYDRSAERITA